MSNTSAETAAVARIRSENQTSNQAVIAKTNVARAEQARSSSSSPPPKIESSISNRVLTEQENIAMIKAPVGSDMGSILYNQPAKSQQDLIIAQPIKKPVPSLDPAFNVAMNADIPKYGGKQEAAAQEKVKIDAQPYYEETRGIGVGKTITTRKEYHEGEMAGWLTPAEPGHRYMKDVLGFASEFGVVSPQKTSELDVYRGNPQLEQIGMMSLFAFSTPMPRMVIGTTGVVSKIGSPSLFVSGKLTGFKETVIKSSTDEIMSTSLLPETKTSISFSKQVVTPMGERELFYLKGKSELTAPSEKIVTTVSGYGTPDIGVKVSPMGNKYLPYMRFAPEEAPKIEIAQPSFSERIGKLSESYMSESIALRKVSPEGSTIKTSYKIINEADALKGSANLDDVWVIQKPTKPLGTSLKEGAINFIKDERASIQPSSIQELRQVTPQKSEITGRYLWSNELKAVGLDTRFAGGGTIGLFAPSERTEFQTSPIFNQKQEFSQLTGLSERTAQGVRTGQQTGQATDQAIYTPTATRIDLVPTMDIPQKYEQPYKAQPYPDYVPPTKWAIPGVTFPDMGSGGGRRQKRRGSTFGSTRINPILDPWENIPIFDMNTNIKPKRKSHAKKKSKKSHKR